MSWGDAVTSDQDLHDAYAEVHDLTEWSPWLPFETAREAAPREPAST